MDKRFGVRMELEEYEDLQEFCNREGMKISEAVRYILNKYLDNYFGDTGE